MKWLKGHMPDITPAQVIAAVTWAIAQGIAWGWVNNDDGQRIISTASTLISGAWIFADMLLRSARNKRLANEALAKAALVANQPFATNQP